MMILPSEIAELQEIEETELGLAPVFACMRCQAQITEPNVSSTAGLCSACATELSQVKTIPTNVTAGPKTITTYEAATLRVEFNHAVEHLVHTLNDLTIASQDNTDGQGNQVWQKIEQLSQFLQASTHHLELIATLAQLVSFEPSRQLSRQKMDALLEAFQLLSGRFVISEAVLGDIYHILERAGFAIDRTIKATSA